MSWRQIAGAVDHGRLKRLRRDRYVLPGADADVAEAVRIGGRVSCLSLLAAIGVFVHHCDVLHVHVVPGTSRIRNPTSEQTKLHWRTGLSDVTPLHVTSVIDALSLAIRCQTPRAALATLDSALHHGLVTWDQVIAIFDRLPERFAPLIGLIDASAESGPETFMRLILRAMGVSFKTQVIILGVGRVDFVVDGWLIIECDSRAFHSGWDQQIEDRRRDLAAARLGYVTIRPLASDIMGSDSSVRDAVSEVIRVLGPRFT
jgi:very-short-patch-repair endonuclease